MPAASYFEAPNCGASLSGVHPGMFRPPASPSLSSSTYLGRSTGSLFSDISTPGPNSKRKRRRARDSTTPLNEWAMTGDYSSTAYGTTDHRFDTSSRRYILAGQIETPSGPAQRNPNDMDESVYSDIDYRRDLGSKRPCDELVSPQFGYSTTHPPPGTQPQQSSSWSFFSINTLSGVVGKVWEFCKTGGFRGFYAGGGKGYDVQGVPSAPTQSAGQVWCNEHDIPTLPDYRSPESDYPAFAYDRDTPDSTPPPPAKRRHIYDGAPGDELRRNWVMVSEPASKRRQSVTSRSSVTRPQPRSKFAAPHGRRMSRPISRLSTSSFSLHTPPGASHVGSASSAPREPASFASPRSPPSKSHTAYASSPTASRLPVPNRPQSSGDFSHHLSPYHQQQQPSRIASPTPYSTRQHQRTNSTASSKVFRRGEREDVVPTMQQQQQQQESTTTTTPRLDAEAQTLAARRMHDEMATDMRISNLNATLRDLIRQGKEALGTRIEVEDGDRAGGGGGCGSGSGSGGGIDDAGEVMDTWEDE